MKILNNIINIKKNKLVLLEAELKNLQYKMADPRTINNKHEEISALKKELQVMADLDEVSRDEQSDDLKHNLQQLQNRYKEQKETLERITPRHLGETPKTIQYIEENISILKNLKKAQQEATEDLMDFPSFLDDVD